MMAISMHRNRIQVLGKCDSVAELEIPKDLLLRYRECELCPRRCGVDRTRGEVGICREGDTLRVASVEAHMGEEPPISGVNGSGTVFFTACSLRCIYCQNHQISHEGLGREWSVGELVEKLVALHESAGIHNVNFVTPDHFLPHTVAVVEVLRRRGIRIPVLYNLSGYQSLESLRLIEPVADIYLPDFKYADPTLAGSLSCCPDYAAVALEALVEMVRQKGFLDSFRAAGDHEVHGGDRGKARPLAGRGVLVRHLILPGQMENSRQVLDMLYVEFGRDVPLSLMSQYVPIRTFPEAPFLDRTVTAVEFRQVLEHAQGLGFRHLFVQYPEKTASGVHPFLPDFSSAAPFLGNVRKPDSVRP
jgi:putative pyruvate formate lyase activating enzyme